MDLKLIFFFNKCMQMSLFYIKIEIFITRLALNGDDLEPVGVSAKELQSCIIGKLHNFYY